MIRLSLYITLAILLAVGAVWLAEHPGNLHITWQDWEIRLSMAVFSALALGYTLACWALFKLYRWFRTDNPLKSPKRLESRRQKGLREMDLGWSALAVEDTAAAIKHAKKAQSLLNGDRAPLRLLLAASPDKDRSDVIKALRQTPESRMLALVSEVKQARIENRLKDAQALLDEMLEISPKNPWIARQRFELLIDREQWADARASLTALAKTKLIEAQTQKHLTAVICYRQAVEADLAGQKTQARDLAKEALKQEPGFIPAAAFLVRHHLAHDDKSAARKLLENTWKIAPHPDLGQLFLELEPMENPSERFRRVQKFTQLNPNALHSRHLLAQTALAAQHWQEAKQALDPIIQNQTATKATYLLLAQLERQQRQDDAAAEVYLAKAGTAPADPIWQCQACHRPQATFAASCPDCGKFGKIEWGSQKAQRA
tara:strand:+ start:1663 stop:2952 length:1290 start_codon:yes stop_codon:yes gene_type:complete